MGHKTAYSYNFTMLITWKFKHWFAPVSSLLEMFISKVRHGALFIFFSLSYKILSNISYKLINKGIIN